MTPGEAIRALRLELGLTQAELAELVGVTSTTIYTWEAGRTAVSSTQLARVAEATGAELRVEFRPRS